MEAEIAELSRQIEEKKRVLEGQSGIVREDKELVSETVAEHFYVATPKPTTAQAGSTATDDQSAPAPVPQPVSDDYLATLPPEQVEILNAYISMVPKDGIKATVNKLMMENPFMLDAFHDVLVTRLYEELKTRGIIK